MKTPLIIDLRNLLNDKALRLSGFRYVGIGGSNRQAFGEPALSVVSGASPWPAPKARSRAGDTGAETITAAE